MGCRGSLVGARRPARRCGGTIRALADIQPDQLWHALHKPLHIVDFIPPSELYALYAFAAVEFQALQELIVPAPATEPDTLDSLEWASPIDRGRTLKNGGHKLLAALYFSQTG